jgi:hypothetical protein
MRELSIPSDAHNTQDAVELIRSWIIDGKLQCSLFPSIWAERPETWGLLLAYVAHHISDAASAQGHHTKQQILSSIASRFASEIAAATDEHEGHFIERPNDNDRNASQIT